ncbi:hypothetical protein H5410_027296 [Solanum commersonii]|uniref:Uncharacterized protein n=1 Tax=Solanum commersonii TaxID=4109 RepID=A0A9J5Z302_SOLCO|nr:hypothetical protein H5410_027296 [Solanum commersonii]
MNAIYRTTTGSTKNDTRTTIGSLPAADGSHSKPNLNGSKIQQTASMNSAFISSKIQKIEAMVITISEGELEWARKIISINLRWINSIRKEWRK